MAETEGHEILDQTRVRVLLAAEHGVQRAVDVKDGARRQLAVIPERQHEVAYEAEELRRRRDAERAFEVRIMSPPELSETERAVLAFAVKAAASTGMDATSIGASKGSPRHTGAARARARAAGGSAE